MSAAELPYQAFDREVAALAEADIKCILATAIEKLKTGMRDGPDGEAVRLTPAEATLVYRVLELYGVTR